MIAIPAKYDFKPYAYGFQKDSPYLGLFNHYLKEMREKGALKQILNKYESGAQVCPDESGKPLGFESVFTAFLALLSGLALGLVIYGLEHLQKWGNIQVPLIDTYDKLHLEKEDITSLSKFQMNVLLAQKNATILGLQNKVKTLQRGYTTGRRWLDVYN